MTSNKRKADDIEESPNAIEDDVNKTVVSDDEEEGPKKYQAPVVDHYILPRLSICNLPTGETEEELFEKMYSTELAKQQKLDLTLVKSGHQDTQKNYDRIHGNLTQAQYDLIVEGNMSEDALIENSGGKVTKRNKGIRFTIIDAKYERRKIDDGDKGKYAVFDKKKNLEHVSPKYIYDAILQTHIMNGHCRGDLAYAALKRKYSNIHRDYCRRGVLFCSSCNPEMEVKPFKRQKREGWGTKYNLLPFERVQMDLFRPYSKKTYDGRIIEGKYPYVLYLRDYYSRYMWLYPLENVTVGDILPHFKQFLMSTAVNVPMYLETCTINPEMMKNLVEYVCSEYGLRVGCGLGRLATFQASGIRALKNYFRDKAEECLKDWGKVLQVVHEQNSEYCSAVQEVPRRIIMTAHKDRKQYETKKNELFDSLPATTFRKYYGKAGFFYVEPDNSTFGYEDSDAEEDKVDQTTEGNLEEALNAD